MQRRLSITGEENRKLKADLQTAEEETVRRGEEISSPHRDLSAQEEKYDATIAAWWREVNKECEKADEEMKKRDEQLSSTEPPRSERGN